MKDNLAQKGAILAMGFFQKIFGGGDIEAESRAWMMKCPDCGHEISVWEAGGIRFGAAGKPKRLMKCGKCGKRTWHQVYKKTEGQQESKP